MATIDTTLNSFMIPGLPNYSNAFGTKKGDNEGLSTEECVIVTAMPFARQRPFAVTESSTTLEVEANSVFKVSAGGAVLEIADAAFDGAMALVCNTSQEGITVKGGASGLNGSIAGVELAAGATLLLFYCSGWRTFGAASEAGGQAVCAEEAVAGSLAVAGETALEGAVTAAGNITAAGSVRAGQIVVPLAQPESLENGSIWLGV